MARKPQKVPPPSGSGEIRWAASLPCACEASLRRERATSDAVAALGLAGEIGELRQGLCADLLLVDGDPLHDLAALCRPVGVVARGAFDRAADDQRR